LVRTARATRALGALIAACDAQTTYAELTAVLQRAGMARASEANVRFAVDELVKAGVLGILKREQTNDAEH
jgi:hypothetical protein